MTDCWTGLNSQHSEIVKIILEYALLGKQSFNWTSVFVDKLWLISRHFSKITKWHENVETFL